MKNIQIIDNQGTFDMVGTTTFKEATERLGMRAGINAMNMFVSMAHTHCDYCGSKSTTLVLVGTPNLYACKKCRVSN